MKRLSIAVASLMLAACSSMPSWMPGGGWTTLIDGEKGMENFVPVGDANWRAEQGAIVADKGAKGGFLMTKNSYGDYDLRVEFWADPSANSGIYNRCADPKNLTTRPATRPTSSTSGRIKPSRPAASCTTARCCNR